MTLFSGEIPDQQQSWRAAVTQNHPGCRWSAQQWTHFCGAIIAALAALTASSCREHLNTTKTINICFCYCFGCCYLLVVQNCMTRIRRHGGDAKVIGGVSFIKRKQSVNINFWNRNSFLLTDKGVRRTQGSDIRQNTNSIVSKSWLLFSRFRCAILIFISPSCSQLNWKQFGWRYFAIHSKKKRCKFCSDR